MYTMGRKVKDEVLMKGHKLSWAISWTIQDVQPLPPLYFLPWTFCRNIHVFRNTYYSVNTNYNAQHSIVVCLFLK